MRNSKNSANRRPKHPVCEKGVLCLMCRKRAYANSAVGNKLHLARMLEWATPYTRATPLNELISVVFVNCGDEISQFVGKAAGAMKQYVRLELDMKPVLSRQCSCRRSNRHRGCEGGFVVECEVNNGLAQVSRGTHDPFWRGGVAVRRGSVEPDTNPISSDICTCDLSFGGLIAERLHDSSCENYYRRPFGRYFQKCVMRKRKKKCGKTCLRGGRLTQRWTQDGNCRKKVMRRLWQVAVPCRRVGRRRISQPRCNQRRQKPPKWERRQKKRHASLRCWSWVPKLKAISAARTDNTSNAFPHAVRSAGKCFKCINHTKHKNSVQHHAVDAKVVQACVGQSLQTHRRTQVISKVSMEERQEPRLKSCGRLDSSPRFQGGGSEHLVCLVCLPCTNACIPKQLADKYVTHCCTYGRGACTAHGTWQVQHFHSDLCHGDEVCDLRCLSLERPMKEKTHETVVDQPGLHKKYRFIGGGPVPAWTSSSASSSSSSLTILSTTVGLPVCILCSRRAPVYLPLGFQEAYSAKCSRCKRTNCNKCGNWEGTKFFCKWCFDEGIAPSVEAMQSWKAVQQTCTNMPGGKHRASEGRASSKTTPKNCRTSLLKS